MFDKFITELYVSLISSFITSIGWIIWRRIKEYDNLPKFIGLDTKSPVTICYGNIQTIDSQKKPISSPIVLPTTSFDYGDIDSTLIVYDRLSPTVKGTIKHIANDMPDFARDGNIFAVGGPKWNKITEFIIGSSGSPFYYSAEHEGLIERRRNHPSENIYQYSVKKLDDGGLEITDYGCIICVRNNYLGTRIPLAMSISGYTTFGVLIAARNFTDLDKRTVRKLKNNLSGSDRFCLLSRGTVRLNSKGQIESTISTKLMTWVPEQDFNEPYTYKY